MSAAQRFQHDLGQWPDSSFGVLKKGSTYQFFAARGVGKAMTSGTLQNPVATSVRPETPIQGLKDNYDYAAGGHVYRDPETHMLLLFYHAEKWPQGDPQRYYSLLGMAKSTDDGMTWHDLGAIVTPEVPFGARPVEVTGGPFVVTGDYFYVYFRDGLPSGDVNLAVARARVADVLRAAEAGRAVTWSKYYHGAFTEPGLGGRSSQLTGDIGGGWFDVAYDSDLNEFVMVNADELRTIWLRTSSDGITWDIPELIRDDPGENIYVSIVGTGGDPRIPGRQFYLYYVSSQASAAGGDRWQDATLVRRLVVLPGPCGA